VLITANSESYPAGLAKSINNYLIYRSLSLCLLCKKGGTNGKYEKKDHCSGYQLVII
jgi:hypothetical protein